MLIEEMKVRVYEKVGFIFNVYKDAEVEEIIDQICESKAVANQCSTRYEIAYEEMQSWSKRDCEVMSAYKDEHESATIKEILAILPSPEHITCKALNKRDFIDLPKSMEEENIMMYERIIKFIVRNKIVKDNPLIKEDNYVLRKNIRTIGLKSFIENQVLGIVKTKTEDGIKVKASTATIFEKAKKINSNILARQMQQYKIDEPIAEAFADYDIGNNQVSFTIMLHPQGYTQNAECCVFIPKTVIMLNKEGYTVGEIIFFLARLQYNLSPRKLSETEISKESLRHLLESTLGPWQTALNFMHSGFVYYNYSNGADTEIDPDLLENIFNYDISDCKTFGDLIPVTDKGRQPKSLLKLKEDTEVYSVTSKFYKAFHKQLYRFSFNNMLDRVKYFVNKYSQEELKQASVYIKQEEELNFRSEERVAVRVKIQNTAVKKKSKVKKESNNTDEERAQILLNIPGSIIASMGEDEAIKWYKECHK